MNFIIVQFPIILVSLAYSAGIFISNYSSGIKEVTSLFVSFCFLIVLIVLEKYLKRKDAFKTYFILSSIVVLSFLINSLRISPRNQNYGSLKSEIIITKLFNSNEKYQNCIAKDISNSRKYLAVIPVADSKYYKVGTKLFVEAETEKLDGLSIPNNFNFTEYLNKKDVHTRMLIHNYTETTDKLKVSSKIEDKIDESSLGNSSKGLIKALVLGRKDGIPDRLMDSFSDSGIMHLLALSGLHIGILTVILTFLLRPLKLIKRGKLIRSFVVVGLLWYYAYITGFSSSIIRATIMFSIIVIGHGMRREVNIYNSLAIAALVLLIINPNYLFDVGFQLSFSAVIGIVWIFPMLNKLWRPRSKVVRYVWSLLIVSIAAQIATFPFTVFYFHKFSGLFFVANIIEIPLITILLAFSYLIIVLLMFGFEYNLLVYIYDKTVNVIEWVSLEISRIESMIFDDIFIDKLTVVILFILIISTIILFQTKKNKYLFVGLMAIVSLQISVIYQTVKTSNKQVLMIAKNEILLQNSNEYSTNKEEGAKLFSNYTKAKKLKLTAPILDDIFSFDNNYYWRIGENIESNPIQEQHSIIVDKQSKSNPEKIVNNNSVGVIYSGYKNSRDKTRWDYFCERNNIAFYDVNEKLFVD